MSRKNRSKHNPLERILDSNPNQGNAPRPEPQQGRPYADPRAGMGGGSPALERALEPVDKRAGKPAREPKEAGPVRAPKAPKRTKQSRSDQPRPHLNDRSWETKISPIGLWRAAWILGAVGALVGVAAGGPFLGHDWQTLWVVIGAALVVGAAALALESRAQAHEGWKLGWVMPAVVLFVVLVGVSGVVTTSVVGGRPVLSTSTEAKMLDFSTTSVERLYRLGEIDAILDLDQVQGRLSISELEASYREVEGWSIEYEALEAEDLEVEELVAVELVLEVTVSQALATIDNHLRWLKTGDPVAQRVAQEHRQAMSRGVLEAGLLLAGVAEKYGLIISEVEGGLVE